MSTSFKVTLGNEAGTPVVVIDDDSACSDSEGVDDANGGGQSGKRNEIIVGNPVTPSSSSKVNGNNSFCYWECSVCTLINVPGSTRCEICHEPLKKKPSLTSDVSSLNLDVEMQQQCFTASTKQTDLDTDAALAAFLQEEERYRSNSDILELEERKEKENEAMRISNHGRAWLFVNKVLERHKRLASSPRGDTKISPVAVDDMVFLAEKFLDCQDAFRRRGLPVAVTLAYHYTKEKCIESIKQDGLMSLADRRDRYIASSSFHGATYGDGVYTASSPYAFHGLYGDVGLLVAVLVGNSQRVYGSNRSFKTSEVNTVIGNKRCVSIDQVPDDKTALFDEIVLLQSSQCLPLVRFCATLISKSDDHGLGNKSIWSYQREMQRLIDEFFNNENATTLTRIFPSSLLNHPSSSRVTLKSRKRFSKASSFSPPQTLPGLPPPNVGQQTLPGPPAVVGQQTLPSLPAVVGQKTLPGIPPIVSQQTLPGLSPTVGQQTPPGLPPIAVQHQFQSQEASQPCTALSALKHNKGALTTLGTPPFQQHLPQKQTASLQTQFRQIIGHQKSRHQATNTNQSINLTCLQHQQQPLLQVPPPTSSSHLSLPLLQLECLIYQAPSSLKSPTSSCIYEELEHCTSNEDCVICMEPLQCPKKSTVYLKVCRHEFHLVCIESSLEHDSKCPVCRSLLKEPQGKCPSGSMTVSTVSSPCAGYERCKGSIMIKYSLRGGIQMPYHYNPGQRYEGTFRTAFLPNNEEGMKLLKRLMYAWMKGLTFTVGTSLTTGRPNSIVWASIHHKTSQSGGAGTHGFPDDGFFSNCNEELNSLGVPSSQDCP